MCANILYRSYVQLGCEETGQQDVKKIKQTYVTTHAPSVYTHAWSVICESLFLHP